MSADAPRITETSIGRRTIYPLIDFWRRCDLHSAPFAHPDDLPILQKKGAKLIDADAVDFESFLAGSRFGDFDDNRLHLSLLPAPYSGDLRRAEIVILLLNPGFSFTDYWAEYKRPEFRKRRLDTLQQEFTGVEFPFLELDPEFCWHGGFSWWEKKLRAVISLVAERKFGGCYLSALRDLSKRLASVELVPYHSASFSSHALIRELPSVRMVQDFVRESLIPTANTGQRTIIVTRQVKVWAVPLNSRNVITYTGGATRNASLSPASEGGKAILRHYGIG